MKKRNRKRRKRKRKRRWRRGRGDAEVESSKKSFVDVNRERKGRRFSKTKALGRE